MADRANFNSPQSQGASSQFLPGDQIGDPSWVLPLEDNVIVAEGRVPYVPVMQLGPVQAQ